MSRHLKSPTKNSHESTFKDGTRSIDFVLVYKNDVNLKKSDKRRIFQSNLKKVGLELEEDEPVEGLSLRFVKIHAPKNVCRKYCEKLKLRMPTKKVYKKNEKSQFKCSASNEWYGMIRDWVSRKTDYNHRLFPSTLQYQTAVYSRDTEYLFDVNATNFFTPTIRATIVQFIVDRTSFSPNYTKAYDFGIHQAYCAAYPLHEGDCDVPGTPRRALYCGWASIRNTFRYQPLDHIREYFGTEIAQYFTWLGFYTFMLLVPAILGLVCFLYTWSRSRDCLSCEKICGSFPYKGSIKNMTIQYRCGYCLFWEIHDTCLGNTGESIRLFEDCIVVLFTIFMCVWCASFLELWKQYSAEMIHKWGAVTAFDKCEERPRSEYLIMLRHHSKRMINALTNEIEPNVPFWTRRLPIKLLTVPCTIILIFISFIGVRVSDYFLELTNTNISDVYLFFRNGVLSTDRDFLFKLREVLTFTPPLIRMTSTSIMNSMYAQLARYFTNLGLHRTQNEYDDSLTRKLCLFHSVNYYSSEFHLVFVRAKLFIGWPIIVPQTLLSFIWFGDDTETCGLDGCLPDLRARLRAIMISKQIINALKEYTRPIIGCWWSGREIKKAETLRQQKECEVASVMESKQWINDYKLLPSGPRSMFPEYLEMVVQFGFIMLFAHAFPLAPLFALVNNVVEVRLDAKKIITFYRRPVPQVLVKHSNIWYKIMDSIGDLAIFTNGFMIAFQSDFIPKIVYLLKQGNYETPNKYSGYLLSSLSYANVLKCRNRFCRLFPRLVYRGNFKLRIDDIKKWSKLDEKFIDFWICLAARLLFMALFQNFMAFLVSLVRRYIRSRNVFGGSTGAKGITDGLSQYDKRVKQPTIFIETQV